MATIGGYNVVTDGLVLSLDAGNRRSYVSGSNTWFDVSGNGNSGSLVNGPGFDSGNGGSLVFDGVDDLCRTALPVATLGNLFTVCIFFNLTSLASSNPDSLSKRLITADRSSGSTKWAIGVDSNSNFLFAGFAGVERTLRFPINLNTNYFVTIVHNVTTYSMWLNNEIKILNDTSNIDATSFGNVSIACRPSVSDRLWTGSVFFCSMYNRALSPTEILQNYNSTKGRFGL